MIKRVSEIHAVGKFKNFSLPKSGEYDFAPFTVIFGANTKGKSTLTSILRSYSTGDTSHIIGRKSFGLAKEQAVYLLVDENGGKPDSVRFQEGKWNKRSSKLFIFDSRFVAENVHVDGIIREEHHKKLEEIILGQEGEDLLRRVSDATAACTDNEEKRREITRQYNSFQKPSSGLEFKSFRELGVDKEISNKIKKKEEELDAYRKYTDIKQTLERLKGSLSVENYEAYKVSLKKTLSVNLESIRYHISEHMVDDESARQFLFSGYKLSKSPSDPCVFCGQDITSQSAKDLLKDYSVVFSQNYNELNREVSTSLGTIEKTSFKIKTEPHIERLSELGLEIDISADLTLIEKTRKSLEEQIRLKSQDLNRNLDLGKISNFCEAIVTLREKVEKELLPYEDEYDDKKLTDLKAKLFDLHVIKTRSEGSWKDLCRSYTSLETTYKKLQVEAKKAIEAKQNYSLKVCGKYQKLINDNLTKLNAEFKLADVRTREGRTSKKPIYGLEFFDEHKVNLSPNDPSDPCFDNTLSESDKRLLAFSFFMAELERHKNRKDLIVVLDDPMSSFDDNRKLRTAELLVESSQHSKQVIILTHERGFLRMINEKAGASKSFIIKSDGEKQTSVIDLLDINEEYLDPHFSNLSELKALLSADDEDLRPNKLVGIRDVIEHIQVRKYYFTLQDEIRKGNSVGAFTDKLLAEEVYTVNQAERIRNLLSSFWKHDDSLKVLKKEDFSPSDLKNIIEDFFEVIKIV